MWSSWMVPDVFSLFPQSHDSYLRKTSDKPKTLQNILPPQIVNMIKIKERLRNWQRLKKAMAPHSSTLAWKIPWMEEPGGLQSMESLRVGHDWATSLSLFTFMHWRRKWQPTPVFLPGESQGWGSLVGCHLWGRTESDTTEALVRTYQYWFIPCDKFNMLIQDVNSREN